MYTHRARNCVLEETLTNHLKANASPSTSKAAVPEEVRCVDFCQVHYLLVLLPGQVTLDVKPPTQLNVDIPQTVQHLQSICPSSVTVSALDDSSLRVAWLFEAAPTSATVEWISSIR
jgi:hypothetical protein